MTEVSDFYSQDNQVQAGWMKFAEVWDSVKGTFIEKFNKAGSNGLPDQVVFTLTNATDDKVECDEEGEIKGLISSDSIDGEINVGIKASNTYILSRLKNVMPWDIIWFAFTKEIAPKVKGYNAAKSIQVFKAGVDEEYLKQIPNKTNSSDEISVDEIPF